MHNKLHFFRNKKRLPIPRLIIIKVVKDFVALHCDNAFTKTMLTLAFASHRSVMNRFLILFFVQNVIHTLNKNLFANKKKILSLININEENI